MEFVSFDLAKKLKEKGLSCKYPLAMYNERGSFCPLFTSADRNPNIRSVFGNREYYDYDDFDEKDFIAPTIEQVLEWLREEKKIFIEIALSPDGYQHIIYTGLYCMATSCAYHFTFDGFYRKEDNYITYEQAVNAGIEYVIDNLI